MNIKDDIRLVRETRRRTAGIGRLQQ